MEQPVVFDAAREIVIPVPTPEGVKRITVRFPSDQQWIEWRLKKKIQQKDLGRRYFQVEASTPGKADAQLLEAIRVDHEVQLDDAEAAHVLSRLSECDCIERPEREGSSFTIPLKVLRKIDTTHTLKIPSIRQITDFEKSRSDVTFGPYGQQIIAINYAAPAALYDKIIERTTGYAGAVPVIHKAEVINVLLQEVRESQEEAGELGE